MDISINWLAVLVAGIVNMAVGFVWYGPLFGKTWKSLMGFTDESMKSMKMTSTQAMVGGFITALIMAYVLAHFMGLLGIADLGAAMQLACWIWLGFMATVMVGSYLWEGKPFKLFVLNAVEGFVAIHLMALVIFLMM